MFRDNRIDGQQDFAPLPFGRAQYLARRIRQIRLAQRVAHIDALGVEKGVGHGAADNHAIELLHQIAEHGNFCRNFCPANHRRHRAFGVFQRARQRGDLRHHRHARISGQCPRQGVDGGMRPVRYRKCLVHIDVAETCERLCEFRIIGLFAGVKAQILQKQHIAVFKRIHCPLDIGANAVFGKIHRRAWQHFIHLLRDGPERHNGHTLALGPAEMGQEDDLRAPFHERFNRG